MGPQRVGHDWATERQQLNRTKTPTNGRYQHFSFQRRPPEAKLKEPEKHFKKSPEIKGVQTLYPSNHCYNNSSPNPPWLRHSFQGQEFIVSPFVWQSNKAFLFYFTQNSVSEIWFGTSADRWVFGINTISSLLLCGASTTPYWIMPTRHRGQKLVEAGRSKVTEIIHFSDSGTWFCL